MELNAKIAKLVGDVSNWVCDGETIHPIDELLVSLDCEVDIVSDSPGGVVFQYAGETLAHAYDGTLEIKSRGSNGWLTLVAPSMTKTA